MLRNFYNKIRPYFPIIVPVLLLIMVASPFPFGVHEARADWLDFTDLPLQIAKALTDAVGEMYNFLFEWVILPAASFILGAIGLVLDAVVKINLDSSILKSITGIDIGWRIIRDLINMAFIFILLYVSISTILGQGSYQAKSYLPKIIMAALLINFSLFFSKVVIDGGNIVAHGFYSALTNNGNTSMSKSFIESTKIGASYNPATANGSLVPRQARPEDLLSGTSKYLISIMRLILLLAAIYVFASVVLIFVGRIIGLTFVLMLSPIGFIGGILPGAKGASSWWWSNLIDQTLVAPVFFVLYYLAIQVITGFSNSLGRPGIVVAGDIDPTFYINYIIAIGLLLYVVKTTKKLGGEFGSMAQKIGTSIAAVAGTVALGAATGGGAFLARGALGRTAAGVVSGQGALGGKIHSIAGGEGMLGKTKLGRWAAKKTITGVNTAQKSGFDLRESKGFQTMTKGLTDNKWVKKMSVGDSGIGNLVTRGYSKNVEKKGKDEKAYLDTLTKGSEDAKRKFELEKLKMDEVIKANLEKRDDYKEALLAEKELAPSRNEAKTALDAANADVTSAQQQKTQTDANATSTEADKLAADQLLQEAQERARLAKEQFDAKNMPTLVKEQAIKEETLKVTEQMKGGLQDLAGTLAKTYQDLEKLDVSKELKDVLRTIPTNSPLTPAELKNLDTDPKFSHLTPNQKNIMRQNAELQIDRLDVSQLKPELIDELYAKVIGVPEKKDAQGKKEADKIEGILDKSIAQRTVDKERYLQDLERRGLEGRIVAEDIRKKSGKKEDLRKALELLSKETGVESAATAPAAQAAPAAPPPPPPPPAATT